MVLRIAIVGFTLTVLMLSCKKDTAPVSNPNSIIVYGPNVVNVLDYGAKADGTSNDSAAIAAAMTAAHAKKLPLYFPSGKYLARIQLLYDSLILEGEQQPASDWNSGTIISGLIDCNKKRYISIKYLGIDSRGKLLSGDAAALSSGSGLDNQPLYQSFTNLSLIGDGYAQFKHGILCQAGSDITLRNIYVSDFYHGVALRCSNVDADTIQAEFCGFTSVLIKSAEDKNNLTQNVNIRNVKIVGDPANVFRRGGVVLIQSFSPGSLTQNIFIDKVSSSWGGVGVVNVEQLPGSTVRNVSVSNCYGEYCGDKRIRASYDINGGTDITYTACNSVQAFGIAYRSTGAPVNLSLRNCNESFSRVAPWYGVFKYLQLNGVEIIK